MTRDADELLRVEGLCKFFPVARGVFGKTVGYVRAVDEVSFTLRRGETLGLVGESGCGKTTAGRSILRLIEPTSGRVCFDGTDILALSERDLRAYRRRMQIVFQDPYGSLNPRLRVVDLLGEAIERYGLASGAAIEGRVRELLGRVGLPARALSCYPHEFSGGQRQRIGVARALAVAPDLIVCDEAVSALDVSIQAQVINLFIDLRRELNLSLLFIAHDLSVVRHIADRVAVMYLGELVEIAPSIGLFQRPAHPYTRALLSAIPSPDPRQRRRRVVLHGDVPTPIDPPSGCHFHPRCPSAVARCSEAAPPVVQLEGGKRQVRCVHVEGLELEPNWYAELECRLARVAAERATRAHVEVLTPSHVDWAAPALADVPRSPEPVSAAGSSPARRSLPLVLAAGLAVAPGLGLVAFGFWGAGSTLSVAAAYVLAEAAPGSLTRLFGRRPAWKFLGLVVACAVASGWLEPLRRAAQARQQMGWVSQELVAYRNNVGQFPPALGDLNWRTVEHFGPGQPRDPWGQPFRYTRHVNGFELSSDGADGVPSSDDVVLEPIADPRY